MSVLIPILFFAYLLGLVLVLCLCGAASKGDEMMRKAERGEEWPFADDPPDPL